MGPIIRITSQANKGFDVMEHDTPLWLMGRKSFLQNGLAIADPDRLLDSGRKRVTVGEECDKEMLLAEAVEAALWIPGVDVKKSGGEAFTRQCKLRLL